MSEALQPMTPAAGLGFLEKAIESGATAETIEKLVQLAERMQAHEAQRKYAEAIAGFQAECPTIFKDSVVPTRTGGVKFTFAGYDAIKRITAPLQKKWGITTSFQFEFREGMLHGTIRVRVGSHFEDKTSAVPIPKGYDTNAAQDGGQAMTYLKRYLYCAALDIVTTDDRDNDGAGLYEKITDEQAEEIHKLIDQCDKAGNPVDVDKFLKWLDVPAIEEMPAAKFRDAAAELQRKAKGGKR